MGWCMIYKLTSETKRTRMLNNADYDMVCAVLS